MLLIPKLTDVTLPDLWLPNFHIKIQLTLHFLQYMLGMTVCDVRDLKQQTVNVTLRVTVCKNDETMMMNGVQSVSWHLQRHFQQSAADVA